MTCNRIVKLAIYTGELYKSPYCEECKQTSSRLLAHHYSYKKPLNVMWLCSSCHGREHSRINIFRKINQLNKVDK